MKKQAFNPYLPAWEYTPDCEPYVFDGRVYSYGSHDRFNSLMYCLNDYVAVRYLCLKICLVFSENIPDGNMVFVISGIFLNQMSEYLYSIRITIYTGIEQGFAIVIFSE